MRREDRWQAIGLELDETGGGFGDVDSDMV
ncbi:MAG: hypothetical protein UX78_C0005G0052 [Candidatus Amesbacteria bacterium GW2011_GWA2_47_11]|mgnify:CR=1 FL=1|uniref:Uncharacterized protein n=3 Tax=Candidatus Amesiibacteriota TaxID=1752730 RepID=A0A0G1XHH1_9BACT|nr:MAG: hypothetical protein UX78_C0005G0052 [Candidatus Amesbacteria bacterium GW2011_GWA2_47_11]KKU93770.1 MAG: hypothetical protein UY22_C0017G0027 [Candidatus Amesbacteria bacterium GW2011_GWC1_48_10]KKU99564.1 MAG: hypothetical protein UY33_C0028G0018 [Candidatus Amesbacteria bacterium GW2011_GWA1_48_9]